VLKGQEQRNQSFQIVCSLYGNTKIQASKLMTVFVNTLLEQLEHHRSDIALSLYNNNNNNN
jgi:hypothetical protein